MNLWLVALSVCLFNIPFGYWRESVRKFSLQWILAIHLPVPLVIALRIFSGLGWRLITFPVLIGAYFLGQFIGGKLRKRLSARESN
ncbi:MAG: hypothetical protein AB1757_16545 [Acidobacteriota bacterium]